VEMRRNQLVVLTDPRVILIHPHFLGSLYPVESSVRSGNTGRILAKPSRGLEPNTQPPARGPTTQTVRQPFTVCVFIVFGDPFCGYLVAVVSALGRFQCGARPGF